MDEKDFNKLTTDVAVFTATVTEWMKTTSDYRLQLCAKIDKITDKLYILPCSERKGWYQSMGRQVKFMWGFITGIIILLFFGKYRLLFPTGVT